MLVHDPKVDVGLGWNLVAVKSEKSINFKILYFWTLFFLISVSVRTRLLPNQGLKVPVWSHFTTRCRSCVLLYTYNKSFPLHCLLLSSYFTSRGQTSRERDHFLLWGQFQEWCKCAWYTSPNPKFNKQHLPYQWSRWIFPCRSPRLRFPGFSSQARRTLFHNWIPKRQVKVYCPSA